jgi:hypothetical protein
MDLISEQYRNLNIQAHQQQRGYGARGGRRRHEVIHIAKKYGIGYALDYGCGKGDLKRCVPELAWNEYDPAIAEFSRIPQGRYEMVFCGDVLEHIEPEKLNNVLEHIFGLIDKVGLFVVNTLQGGRKLPDGSFAHRIVESNEWWIEKLKQFSRNTFEIKEWFHKENGDVYILAIKNAKFQMR